MNDILAEIEQLTRRTGAQLINPVPGMPVPPHTRLMMLRIIDATLQAATAKPSATRPGGAVSLRAHTVTASWSCHRRA